MTILVLNALKEIILHLGCPGVPVVSMWYSGWVATGGGSNKHSISSTHTWYTMYVRICIWYNWFHHYFKRMKIFCMVRISHRPTFGGIVKVKGAVSLAGDAEGWLWPVGFPEAGGSAVNLCSLQFVVSFGLGEYICSSSWAKLCACFVHCILCTLSSTMTLYFYDAVSDTVRRRGWYRAIVTEEGQWHILEEITDLEFENQ